MKQALEHGLILKKVHRAILFKHSKWLEPYIMLNTELRKNAKNAFEKGFFKLTNNSIFRKTMENVRNRRDIKLEVTEVKRKLLTSQRNFEHSKKFSQNFEAIEMRKSYVFMNKPISV